MKRMAKDSTLYKIAADYGWEWAYGPYLNKAHRHQLYWNDYLAKAPVDRGRIPSAQGAMLNAMAFGITFYGFIRLMILYPESSVIEKMKFELFDNLFANNNWIIYIIKERERSNYRRGKNYQNMF